MTPYYTSSRSRAPSTRGRCVSLVAVIMFAACGPSYWRPPARTIPEETIGPDAKIEIGITWGVPDPDRPRPAWLGPAGEPNNAQLASQYGPRMFHNGRKLTFVRVPYQVGASGTVALAECPPIVAVGRTANAVASEIESCAARFVDRTQALVHIDDNPSWTVAIVRGGKTHRVRAHSRRESTTRGCASSASSSCRSSPPSSCRTAGTASAWPGSRRSRSPSSAASSSASMPALPSSIDFPRQTGSTSVMAITTAGFVISDR